MADNEIADGLAKAAAALTKRTISPVEKVGLLKSYRSKSGTETDKLTRALGEFTGLTPKQISEKRASDDNADRTMRDLENILRGK